MPSPSLRPLAFGTGLRRLPPLAFCIVLAMTPGLSGAARAQSGAPDDPAGPTALGPMTEEPSIAVYAGAFDVEDEMLGILEAGVELRGRATDLGFLPAWLPVRPMAGIAATSEKGFWLYGGLRYEWQPPREGDGEAASPWGLAASFAASYYEEGDGRDLGGPVEFRSYGGISYRIREAARLELGIHHLSNAGLYELNPGSESVLLSLILPFGR